MSALWQRDAADIRRRRSEWLRSTEPVDRVAAEAAICELYRLVGLGPPRIRWASSPLLAVATGEPGQPWRPYRISDSPVLQRLSELVRQPWMGAVAGLQRFDRTVAIPWSQSWSSCVRAVLDAAHEGGDNPLWTWNSTSGWCSVWAEFPWGRSESAAPLWRAWAEVDRLCGAWWPGERTCVVAERPRVLRTEPAGDLDEVRLHCADGPAVRYVDGWELYFWHGVRVPQWVITAPTAAAVDAETNIEIRRCAIENLGWPAYLEQAGTRLVATAPDPGNDGFELLLYDMARDRRVVVATNGSLERDGTRRRYGLSVPGHFTDPIAAVAWTYGLSAAQYCLLVQRT